MVNLPSLFKKSWNCWLSSAFRSSVKPYSSTIGVGSGVAVGTMVGATVGTDVMVGDGVDSLTDATFGFGAQAAHRKRVI